MSKIMPISNLAKKITECWDNAEKESIKDIYEKYPDADENYITFLFGGNLRRQLNLASQDKIISNAFLSDLKKAFPEVTSTSLHTVANGLVATVTFHPNRTEGKTGGDLGLVLIRPTLSLDKYRIANLSHDTYERGLLCQAKVFRRSNEWGEPTANQKKHLPNKLDYLALLLYRYQDNDCRKILEPFKWQITKGYKFEDVTNWLKKDKFPELKDSDYVIRALSTGKIGTDDKAIIMREISPDVRESLIIRVYWREGDDPGSSIPVVFNQNRMSEQAVKLRNN